MIIIVLLIIIIIIMLLSVVVHIYMYIAVIVFIHEYFEFLFVFYIQSPITYLSTSFSLGCLLSLHIYAHTNTNARWVLIPQNNNWRISNQQPLWIDAFQLNIFPQYSWIFKRSMHHASFIGTKAFSIPKRICSQDKPCNTYTKDV